MGLSFFDKIAMSAVRGLLNGLIGKFTASELQKAIDDDSDLWSVTPGWVKRTGSLMKGNYGKSFKKYFDERVDTEMILTWLSYDQPHLYEVIRPNPFETSHDKAYLWLDRQVTKIKDEIKKL